MSAATRALEPAAAVRSACAVLDDREWSPPRRRTVPEHQFTSWCADPRGVARAEVHAAPGLATVTERQRREMLDDPDLAHLHEVLRLGEDPPA